MANKYLHLFETQAQFDNARQNNYREPWVSLTMATEKVDYNKIVNESEDLDSDISSDAQ